MYDVKVRGREGGQTEREGDGQRTRWMGRERLMKEQDGRWTEGEIGGEGETDQEIGGGDGQKERLMERKGLMKRWRWTEGEIDGETEREMDRRRDRWRGRD